MMERGFDVSNHNRKRNPEIKAQNDPMMTTAKQGAECKQEQRALQRLTQIRNSAETQ